SESEELFTARKSGGKPFYMAVERRDQADKKLRESTVTRDAIKQASDAFEVASNNLADLSETHSSIGKSLALCQRALRVRQTLSRLDSLQHELSGFADLVDVPDRQMAEWRKALGQFGELQRQIVILDEAAAKDATETAALTIDAGLLSEKSTIDALRERLGAIRKAAEDLPRRRQARDAAIATLEEAAKKLGLSSHGEILAKLPHTMALAQARDLIDKRKSAELALADADARCKKLQKERDEHAAQDQSVHLMDIDHVRQRFDALGDVSSQAERLLRERAAFAIEIESIAAGLAALTPPVGDLTKLRSLPIPDAAIVASYAERSALLEGAFKLAGNAVAASAKAMSAAEAEIARLSRDGSDATRGDLLRAREERDQAFAELKASLDGDRQQRGERLDDLGRSSQAIDAVTDRLLADTQRATRLADVRARLEESRHEHNQHAATFDAAKSRMNDFDGLWRQVWSPCNVTPDVPQAMLRWREKVEVIVTRLNACDAKKAEIQALDVHLLESKGAIISFLQSVGRVTDSALPSAILFREAKARFDQLHGAWTEARTRSVTKARIQSELDDTQAARQSAQELLAQHMSHWPNAMTGICLDHAATAVEANAAMAVWQLIPLAKRDYERDGRSVNSIEDDLRAFDDDVFTIIDRVGPQLR
ncbi:MAG: hypothetical protein Q8M03_07740, partial [Legionella sp.]|nr:hypothetical protein [Legionella sp.]